VLFFFGARYLRATPRKSRLPAPEQSAALDDPVRSVNSYRQARRPLYGRRQSGVAPMAASLAIAVFALHPFFAPFA